MQTRIGWFVVPALLLAAGCGAVAWTWSLAQHIDQLQRAGDQSVARIDRLDALLDDLADGELAYAASGRADSQTLNAASTALQQIASESAALVLHSLLSDSPARHAIAEASSAIAETDGRAQENLKVSLDLMAADLIFTETHAPRRSLREQARVLRTAEASAVAMARERALQQAWAGLGAVAVLFAAVLLRWSRRSSSAGATNELSIAGADAAADSSMPRVDLIAAGDLCTRIGCLRSETDLQAVLEDTKRILEASGVVVWMGAGEELFPVAAAGYELRALTRLGPLFRSAVNATATAWRSGALQIVAGDSHSQSAVVAPMLSPDRCVGVLAIEVAPGGERDASVRAVATMIAAQLSAILAAWPAASTATTAEVLPFDKAASAST